jgi:hypothetical protein
MNNNENRSERTFSKIAVLQGVAFVFLSLFAGVVCPSIANLTQDPENPTSWQASLLLGLRWYWTLPVGAILAVLTIVVSNRLPPTPRAIFGLVISLVLLAFAIFLMWLMLSP